MNGNRWNQQPQQSTYYQLPQQQPSQQSTYYQLQPQQQPNPTPRGSWFATGVGPNQNSWSPPSTFQSGQPRWGTQYGTNVATQYEQMSIGRICYLLTTCKYLPQGSNILLQRAAQRQYRIMGSPQRWISLFMDFREQVNVLFDMCRDVVCYPADYAENWRTDAAQATAITTAIDSHSNTEFLRSKIYQTGNTVNWKLVPDLNVSVGESSQGWAQHGNIQEFIQDCEEHHRAISGMLLGLGNDPALRTFKVLHHVIHVVSSAYEMFCNAFLGLLRLLLSEADGIGILSVAESGNL